jgi:hypothetical protein
MFNANKYARKKINPSDIRINPSSSELATEDGRTSIDDANGTNEQLCTPITLTKFIGPEGSRLTKCFTLDDDGNIVKESAPMYSNAHAETVHLAQLKDIEQVTAELRSNECIGLGVFDVPTCDIVTMANFNDTDYGSGVRTRSKAHIRQPVTGIVLFDHDVDSYMPDHLMCDSPGDVMTKVKRAIPEFSEIAYSGTGSSSNGIYMTVDDQPYKSGNSFHIYLPVKNIDLDKFREFMKVRLWNAGLGFISFSRCGAMLERTIIDLAVLSPERLVYEARPILGDGIHQKDCAWTHHEGASFSGDFLC